MIAFLKKSLILPFRCYLPNYLLVSWPCPCSLEPAKAKVNTGSMSLTARDLVFGHQKNYPKAKLIEEVYGM